MRTYSLTIGERILVLRHRAELSKKALAEIVEVTPATITNYEKNISTPTSDMITKLSIALGVSPNFLSFGFDDPNKEKEERPLV